MQPVREIEGSPPSVGASAGVALVLVLAVIAILTALAMALQGAVQVGIRARPDTVSTVQARYLAEAGVQWVLAQVAGGTDYRKIPVNSGVLLGNGTFSVTKVDTSGNTQLDLFVAEVQIEQPIISVSAQVKGATCRLQAKAWRYRYRVFLWWLDWSPFTLLTWSFDYGGA